MFWPKTYVVGVEEVVRVHVTCPRCVRARVRGIKQMGVANGRHQAQSCAIALRSPAAGRRRSSDLKPNSTEFYSVEIDESSPSDIGANPYAGVRLYRRRSWGTWLVSSRDDSGATHFFIHSVGAFIVIIATRR